MSFVDPLTVADPTTNVLLDNDWGDAANVAMLWLRNPKPGCRLSTVTGTALTTDTPVPFATEVYDTGGCHAGGTPTRITVPTGYSGLWFVSANIRCTSGLFHIWIVLNGTTKLSGQSATVAGAVGGKTSVSRLYVATAADYFEIWVTGGTNIETGEASYFSAQFLHGS